MQNIITRHGVFLSIFNHGVLIMGPSGCGKSELALALLDRKHRLIADDAPRFYKSQEGNIIGFCPSEFLGLLEIRAVGIVNVAALYGSHAVQSEQALELIITLQPTLSEAETLRRRLAPEFDIQTILDTPIQHLNLPLPLCKEVALTVETVVHLAFSSTAPNILSENPTRNIKEKLT